MGRAKLNLECALVGSSDGKHVEVEVDGLWQNNSTQYDSVTLPIDATGPCVLTIELLPVAWDVKLAAVKYRRDDMRGESKFKLIDILVY